MIYTPYTLGVQPERKHPGGQKEERSCVSSGQFHPVDVAIRKMGYMKSKQDIVFLFLSYMPRYQVRNFFYYIVLH